jgi:NAD(P)-dependent dehydrogenase (short-subunit alcohol dehydrogenase family)
MPISDSRIAVVTGLEETTARCRDLGAPAKADRLDIADHEAVLALADAVVTEHGAVRLVIDNAGVALAAQPPSSAYRPSTGSSTSTCGG